MILGTLVLVTLVPIGVLIVRRSPESVGLEPDIVSANASQKTVPTTRDDDWMYNFFLHCCAQREENL